MFLKDRKLHYVYNFLGLKPGELDTGPQVVGVDFVKEKQGKKGESVGRLKVYVGEDVVEQGPLSTQSGHFALCGEGLSIGRDTGDSVSEMYTPFFPFEGGRIVKVEVTSGDDTYIDLERQLMAALARD